MNADPFANTRVTLRRLTDDAMAAWDDFIDVCPDATFFHRAGWRTVIERSFGHRTHYYYAERGGMIVGVLPLVEIKSLLFGHGLISNAFSVCGGPAAVDEAARTALDRLAVDLLETTGADYLEYRCPTRLNPARMSREGIYASFAGPLPASEDANLKQIPRKQRAVVRKAIDSRLTWRVSRDADDLYRLYAVSVRNLGTPVFGKAYFANLVAMFGASCDVLTVRDGATPVASVLNFYFRNRVMPFYTGAIPEARRLGANDLMYWRLMRHAVARGCREFDFGRSKIGTGPYDFKRNWGFEPKPIVHQFLMRPGATAPNLTPLNPKFRLLIAAWKRLPLPVANLLGPPIVRNIG